jgi:hypothetical protein
MQVLMIVRLTSTPTEAILNLVKPETEAVWKLYGADKVRSFHYLADMSGSVLMLEVENLAEAEAIAQQLPMVQAGALKVELLPLKPYTALEASFTA